MVAADRGAPRPGPSKAPGAPADGDTETRILSAFLRLAAERGLAGTTTRALAQAAGVNEVTIFRHFGDKATLIHEAVRRFSPVDELTALDPAVDGGDPARAAAGLRACLGRLAAQLGTHPELLRFGLSEGSRTAELPALLAIPQAVLGFLRRALEQARPSLRTGVDPEAVALQWIGMLLVTTLMPDTGRPLDTSPEATDRRIDAAVRLVLRGAGADEGGGRA